MGVCCVDIKNMSRLRLNDIKSVNNLLARTINSLIADNISEVDARAIGYLANILIKSLQAGELEQRITELESKMLGSRRAG